MRRVISVFACVAVCGIAIPGVGAYATEAGSETPSTDPTESSEDPGSVEVSAADAPSEMASSRNTETPKEIQRILREIERRRAAFLDRIGVSNAGRTVTGFVVGGEDAQIEEVPWQVFLAAGMQYFEDDDTSFVYEFFCGGSIIDEHWIVTAAHCVENPMILEYLHVGAGHSTIAGHGRSDLIKVSDIFVHPGWDSWLLDYDIALLKLETPIALSDGDGEAPKAISLPTDVDASWPAKRTPGLISGWGATWDEDGFYQYLTQLQKGDDVVVLADPGSTKCGLYEVFGAYINPDTMMCAGLPQGGQDACFGDSGGPLAIDVDGQKVLAGVTSWGSMECGAPGFPGMYARVTAFVPWIESILSSPGTPAISDITPLNRALLVAVDFEQIDGAPLTNFEYSLNDGRWTALNPPDTDGEFVIGRLRNGRQYSIRVRSVNEFGRSEPSEPAVGTPSPVLPGAATITSVTPGNRSLQIGIAPPTSNGSSAILGYEYSIDNGKTWRQVRSTKTPLLIGNLRNGVTYSIVIRARTADGSGLASSPVQGTPQVPSKQKAG